MKPTSHHTIMEPFGSGTPPSVRRLEETSSSVESGRRSESRRHPLAICEPLHLYLRTAGARQAHKHIVRGSLLAESRGLLCRRRPRVGRGRSRFGGLTRRVDRDPPPPGGACQSRTQEWRGCTGPWPARAAATRGCGIGCSHSCLPLTRWRSRSRPSQRSRQRRRTAGKDSSVSAWSLPT